LEPINNLNIFNYTIEHTPTEASAGGALLYISNKHSYKIRNDLNIHKKKELESIFIEIIVNNKPNIIVGCIYRHPCMDIVEFNDDYLTPLVSIIQKENNKTLYLAGDFNIDLLKADTIKSHSDFINIFQSSLIRPTISVPTRITHRSSTLIDNIFVNENTNFVESGNFTCSLSDHYPQFIITPNSNSARAKSNKYRRDMSNFNCTEFIHD
jgi:hypothetical protein